MIRRALLLSTLVAGVLTSCSTKPKDPPPACAVIGAPTDTLSWPSDIVWGFADLHAHPAIELAFESRFIWGSALDPDGVDANALTDIEACPVETHDHDARSPLERAVGVTIFPIISELGGYAHAPVGSVSRSWPNARDVIHQNMSVSGIRRAYESGLRLLFAASTDDQAITSFLRGPNVANGFVPTRDADFVSAKRQLDFIRGIVAANSTWMEIADSPDQARAIIGQKGKLAIVLSLEMNGMTEDQTNELVGEGAAHELIPVHLIDNDVGGTAASGDLFNLSSSAHTPIYRDDGQDLLYMPIAATPRYSRPLGWPFEVYSLQPAPLYIMPDDIPYARYEKLCYEPLGSCATTTAVPMSFTQLGQENVRGICKGLADCGVDPAKRHTGVERMQALMLGKKTFIDVTHMGRQSVKDTLDLAGTIVERPFPIVSTHSDVAHVCEKPAELPCEDDYPGPSNERSIEADFARTIIERHGVFGLGSGTGTYGSRAVLASRGAPLVTVSPGSPSACVARGNAPGCAGAPNAEPPDPSMPITSIDISTTGDIPSHILGNARPFVRVEMRGAAEEHAYQRHVHIQPMQCTTQGCSANVALVQKDTPYWIDARTDSGLLACTPLDCAKGFCGSTGYTVDDIASVTLEWEYLGCDATCLAERGVDSDITIRQCRNTWASDSAPAWTMNEITLAAGPTTLAHYGPIAPPVVTLDRNRGRFVVFDREDRPSAHPNVPATGRLLRVSMKAGADDLVGASPNNYGANVCVALREKRGADCVSIAPPIDPGAAECPGGWTSINQHGTWGSGRRLYGFARWSRDTEICGVDIEVRQWSPPPSDDASKPIRFSIDDVRVDAVEDPFGRFVRRYAELSRQIAKRQPGILTFGTDFNGLNGLTDISELGFPDGAKVASVCPIDGVAAPDKGKPASLAPLRMKDGTTLGAKVLVEERGLATYGLLADMMAVIDNYPDCGHDVHTSLMLSAERTLRTWEWITDPMKAAMREANNPLPPLAFACARVPGLERTP